MTPEQLARIQARTERAEGRIPWLYRDSAIQGNATCGIGHLVADLAHASALPFRPPVTAQEWARLMTVPRGMRASAYQMDTQGRLSDAGIDALFARDLQNAEADLVREFPQFPGFPPRVQEALLDMVFNLGLPRFLVKFPHLVCCVRACNWPGCATECHRQQVSNERNQETALLFDPSWKG